MGDEISRNVYLLLQAIESSTRFKVDSTANAKVLKQLKANLTEPARLLVAQMHVIIIAAVFERLQSDCWKAKSHTARQNRSIRH
jgi:hypothetical protein